ncbi:MAG: response regulator transcription factor [Leucobacter sp.]
MGNITLARQHLDRVEPASVRAGTRLWGLYAAARAIAEVEECTPDCDEAVAALERVEDPAPLWPYILLARTRYAELVGRVADSLAFIKSADLIHSPEPGSFAQDVLVARRVEALIVAARLTSARAVYDERASDAPHCSVASLALLCGEQNYSEIDRQLGSVLARPNVTSAQGIQAEGFHALGQCVREGAIRDTEAPGLGYALSLRAHRRVALMFPPLLRDALEPYLSADLLHQWQQHHTKLLLWGREQNMALSTVTPRQVEMLRHLDRGCSYGEIAAIDQVSVNTVKSHLKLLYKRLGVSTSSDALAVARRWGLLDSTD